MNEPAPWMLLDYWHELDPDAAPNPLRPCPDDCLACSAYEEAMTP